MLEHLVPNFEQELVRIAQIARSGYAIAMAYEIRGPEYMLNMFPVEWQDYYTKNLLVSIDPVAFWILGNLEGMARWSEIVDQGVPAAGAAMMKKAGEYGMKFGMTIVQQSKLKGSRSFMSCARADREFTDAEMAELNGTFRAWVNLYGMTHPTLTEEQIQVLRLIAKGHEYGDIAKVLSISESAVKQRVSRLLVQMGVTNRTAAVAIATARKMI